MNVEKFINEIRRKDSPLSKTQLLEELYWSDLPQISQESLDEDILPWLLGASSIEEFSGVQNLYLNPEGGHLDFFQEAIIGLYGKDPLTYIHAALEYPDIGLQSLYIFRNKRVFDDHNLEMEKLLRLTDDESTRDRILKFFKYYEGLCKT